MPEESVEPRLNQSQIAFADVDLEISVISGNFQYKRLGSNMLAILVTKGTKYDCNDDKNGDLIWMQSQFQKGLYLLAISINRDQMCLQIAIIWSLSKEIIFFLQFASMIVSFEIVSISGPRFYHHCELIKSHFDHYYNIRSLL